MKTLKRLFGLMIVPALISASCEGEGTEGPAGPAGNANVKSYTISVEPGDWTEMGTPGNANHMYTALVDTFSVLDEAIATGGMVLVYRINVNLFQTAYIPLPSEEPQTSFTRRWEYLYAPGSIGFTVRDDNNNTLQPGSAVNFKIVLAPSINGKQAAELEKMSYEEAMAVLGLE